MAHSIISNIFGFLRFYTIFLCVHCFSNFQKKILYNTCYELQNINNNFFRMKI